MGSSIFRRDLVQHSPTRVNTMKKFIILLLTTIAAFGADAANDVVISQRNPTNTGFIQRNVGAAGAITNTATFRTQLGIQPTITFGTGVEAALGVNIGSAGAPVLFNGALGTPSSGTATNLTGSSGITGTGALNSGSITSGFGAIDVGTDTITTTGAGSFGALSGTTGTFSGLVQASVAGVGFTSTHTGGGAGFSIVRTGASPSTFTMLNTGGEIVHEYNAVGYGFNVSTNRVFSIAATGASITGNLSQTAGKTYSVSSGTNQRAGNAVLVGGTVTVSNTTVTANTVVMLTRKTSGGTIGTAITYTLSAGASFTINSDNVLDTSTFSYFLIEVP